MATERASALSVLLDIMKAQPNLIAASGANSNGRRLAEYVESFIAAYGKTPEPPAQ